MGMKRRLGEMTLDPLVRRLLERSLAQYVAEFTADVGGGSYLARIR